MFFVKGFLQSLPRRVVHVQENHLHSALVRHTQAFSWTVTRTHRDLYGWTWKKGQIHSVKTIPLRDPFNLKLKLYMPKVQQGIGRVERSSSGGDVDTEAVCCCGVRELSQKAKISIYWSVCSNMLWVANK